MTIDVNAVHSENAELSIVFTLLGIVKEVRLPQAKKEELPMVVTLLGIDIEDKELQLANVEYSIVVIPSGN